MRGYFGVGIYKPKREVNVGGLWRSASIYGAAFICTIGERYQRQVSDTPNTPNIMPLHHYSDMEDLRTHLTYGCPIVGIEMVDEAQLLPSFQHPPRALYLLGAEDHGLPKKVLEMCHQLVQIPTHNPWSLNVATAGSIVIADRYTKELPKGLP